MPERSQHRESEAQDGRSERPAMGRGQPRAVAHTPAGWPSLAMNEQNVPRAFPFATLLSPVRHFCRRLSHLPSFFWRTVS